MVREDKKAMQPTKEGKLSVSPSNDPGVEPAQVRVSLYVKAAFLSSLKSFH